MWSRNQSGRREWARSAFGIAMLMAATGSALAQGVNENFNTVTGAGGGVFFGGQGNGGVGSWDTGILGESAFGGTAGNARFGSVSAQGVTNGGVSGSGAGQIIVQGVNFDLLNETFATVSGTGGGVFLAPNGSPDTFNYVLNWDDGIAGEGAFGGTYGGAVLVGGMSAQGLPTGGVGGSGGGQLVVSNVQLNSGGWYAGLQWPTNSFPTASPLANRGFENGLTSWAVYGPGWNIIAATASGGAPVVAPHSGNRELKMFGQFTGNPNESGVYQQLAAQPGQVWQITAWARFNSDDSIGGTSNYVAQKLEFVDINGGVLGTTQAVILNGSSTPDTWLLSTPSQGTAPAGTAGVRGVIAFNQPGVGTYETGAAHVDDISLKQIGGPGGVDLSTYSLTASVKGNANIGAGETLGSYQLRIEDADGNRLLFNSTATGSYQTIGGSLSTATEADANGNPASGVFDRSSSSYMVVVAFNSGWANGGTLEVDNLRLSNSLATGSAWYAGLAWADVTLPTYDPNQLTLNADIMGGTSGGNYELRLEGYKVTAAGLNESFETVTGTGGGYFLDADAFAGGQTFNYTNDWDTGISGETAFGGVSGNVDIFTGGGFSARGLTSGGFTGKTCELRVENIIAGPGGDFYAGLTWPNQALASTDLGQVQLTAKIRGLTASGGALGMYELRIEDAQGDRIYFDVQSNGNWQTVGGALSSGTVGARLGGGGDGVFNLDSPSYTVVVSFIDPVATWFFGGVLQVDNLFLTPVTNKKLIGSVRFPGVANTAFQNVGGLCSSGISTFGDFSQPFTTATGTGGGAITAGTNRDNWDDGISDEHAFFGTYGNAVIGGGATAQTCASCGDGGGKAGQLVVTNVTPNTGGWYAGLFFRNVPADLSGDLTQIFLQARVKGTPVGGQPNGTYFIRIEDSDLTALSFTVTANGSFQTAGGALSGGTLVQINTGDGVFNFYQPTYTVTIGLLGTAAEWGNGATLTIDDVFLTGVHLQDADSFSVAASFSNEVSTWGTSANLAVDNLFLGIATACYGDLNGDKKIDLADLAKLLSNYGKSGQTPADGDLNGDTFVDLSDLAGILSVYGNICP